jgi:outer membrane protein assembly factor BamB
VKATPTEFTEVARSNILAGKCWNAPAVSNGRIYARSTKEGVCLDLSPK